MDAPAERFLTESLRWLIGEPETEPIPSVDIEEEKTRAVMKRKWNR